ncbi:hypothetical protein LN042_09625 [Kitasatospora sp. RB6PN24]|uniref:hypothetical protein n=1 Tax=Kitasatospora humi TaxID=2893891 RepID=UPI001E5F2DB6|nr:hypothetical protein [Kitasatospora humi]MCC9307359.1 hypothetical protein [Kitasatospora humi]
MWAESLRKFGRPAAVLARPRPQWRRLSSWLAADDVLHQLAAGYYDADRDNVVQVITHRVPPVRVFSAPDPESFLRNFLVNASPHGLIPLPGGQVLSEGALLLPEGKRLGPGEWLRLPGELSTGTGQLVVDGTAVDASRFSYGDYLLTTAEIGETTVAVVSAAALHDEAVRLTLERPTAASLSA